MPPVCRLRCAPLFGAAALILALSFPGRAAAFSQIFAFGDSLTDTGYTESKLDSAPSGSCASGVLFPSPPYVGGACTNGATWLEVLADGLGLAVEPGTAGGTNYAVGGATAATDALGVIPPFDYDGDTEDLSDQLVRFQADTPVIDPDALYVIEAGGNDIQFTARGAIVPGVGQDIAQDAVDAIMSTAQALSSLGAQYFLFARLPDFGLIPDTTLSLAQRATATALTDAFNSDLDTAIAGFTGGTAYLVDMAAVYDAVYAAPLTYGITNTTDSCVISGAFGLPQNVATTCGASTAIQDSYLYMDEIHPTQVVHAEIGAAALAAVPEPSTGLLFGLGVMGIAARRRTAS